jgi:hypothetical protein
MVVMAMARLAGATPAATEATTTVSSSVARGVAMTKAWVGVDLSRIGSNGPYQVKWVESKLDQSCWA